MCLLGCFFMVSLRKNLYCVSHVLHTFSTVLYSTAKVVNFTEVLLWHFQEMYWQLPVITRNVFGKKFENFFRVLLNFLEKIFSFISSYFLWCFQNWWRHYMIEYLKQKKMLFGWRSWGLSNISFRGFEQDFYGKQESQFPFRAEKLW